MAWAIGIQCNQSTLNPPLWLFVLVPIPVWVGFLPVSVLLTAGRGASTNTSTRTHTHTQRIRTTQHLLPPPSLPFITAATSSPLPLFLFTYSVLLVLLVLLSPSLPTQSLVYLASHTHSTPYCFSWHYPCNSLHPLQPPPLLFSTSLVGAGVGIPTITSISTNHRNPLLTIHPASLVFSIHVAEIIIPFYHSF